MAVVETSMSFLARDALYDHEKPYRLRYAAEEGIPTTNLRHEKYNPIKINNIRGREQNFSFERNGFAVLKMDEEMSYHDFNNPKSIQRYLEVVCESLKALLGAEKVQAYQYSVESVHLVDEGKLLTFRRFESVTPVSLFQKKGKTTSTLSPRRSPISVCTSSNPLNCLSTNAMRRVLIEK